MAIELTVLHLLIRYGDAVHELDHSVGAILDTVRRLGLAEDTLAVFSSDNGAATYEKTGGNIAILILLFQLVDLLFICALHTCVRIVLYDGVCCSQ